MSESDGIFTTVLSKQEIDVIHKLRSSELTCCQLDKFLQLSTEEREECLQSGRGGGSHSGGLINLGDAFRW